MSLLYERAKEEITKVLIREYCKQNPGVNENEVIIKCKDGVLIFSDIASVLAELKVRNNFQKALENAGKMYCNLTVHENQRWNDCIESTEHSKIMVDCLHSSPFHHYSPLEWQEMHNFLNNQEQICAKATIRSEECKKKLNDLKKEGISVQSPKGRAVIIEYLNWVIDQLKVLHSVYQKEVEIGDLFAKKANVFIDVKFQGIEHKASKFQIDTADLDKIYKSLKGNKRESLQLEEVRQLNTELLVQTKITLSNCVDEMKTALKSRRERFQEIWIAITQLQDTVDKMEQLNNLDEEGKLPPESKAPASLSPFNRMARYSQSLRNFISKKKNK